MLRRIFRTLVAAAVVALAASVATTAARAAPATGAAGCGSGFGPTKYSTTETIKGKTVTVDCGPASARLRYKGRTYTFKHGTCFRYVGSFKLNLGGGATTMTITATPNGGAEVAAAEGAVSLYVAAKWSGAAVKGTFSSSSSGVTATGSWNCGGPIRTS